MDPVFIIMDAYVSWKKETAHGTDDIGCERAW